MYKRICGNCDNFYICRLLKTRGNESACEHWKGWIPTKEEKPNPEEAKEGLLVTYKNDEVPMVLTTYAGELCDNQIAWRPLPEAYKEGA